jgi:hypothetical protein
MRMVPSVLQFPTTVIPGPMIEIVLSGDAGGEVGRCLLILVFVP